MTKTNSTKNTFTIIIIFFIVVLIVLNFNPIVKDKNIPNPEIVTGDDVDDTSYNEIHDKLDDLLEKKDESPSTTSPSSTTPTDKKESISNTNIGLIVIAVLTFFILFGILLTVVRIRKIPNSQRVSQQIILKPKTKTNRRRQSLTTNTTKEKLQKQNQLQLQKILNYLTQKSQQQKSQTQQNINLDTINGYFTYSSSSRGD